MARAATSPELALFRTPRQWSRVYAAIYSPTTVYTARVNQTFTSYDQVLEITYDTGSGTLADVLPDMTVLVGSTAGAHDKGICRLRDKDADTLFIGETSDIQWENDLYLTIVDDYGLWARHVLIDNGTPVMDGGVAYSNQHASPDPTPIMGSNRVLKLTGASVSAVFNFASSYAINGASITAYATSSPTASGGSGLTTSTPTLEWNTAGWHLVYLTVTANGKSFFGVRYVYVYDPANPPPPAEIGGGVQDVETGGWRYNIRLYDNASLTNIRDHALVILFTEDHYGSTQQEIGSLAGCENIECTGWIAAETIDVNPEAGSVEFTIYTAHYWMTRIPSYPDGVDFTTGTPAGWTEFQNLTVDRGLWHFLHWRTTATRIMDVFLTGDTKFTKEVSSLASNLWEQIRDMAFTQIFARAGVNRYNQLSIEVHPLILPSASRSSIPTVMAIQTGDYAEGVEFERLTIPDVSVVSLSGRAVNSSGVSATIFSLSPGHTYPHYGEPETLDNLLVSSQSQANGLAGLYRSWKNNPIPDLPVMFLANNRLIECFPRQRCSINISADDNPRGYAYSGNIYPVSVSRVFDARTGYMHTEVVFESETFESLSIDGDIPGSGDRSTPPFPSFPPFPDFPVIIPGGFPPSSYSGGPPKNLVHDTNKGLIYTESFDTSSPEWYTVNAGFPDEATAAAVNFMEVCPNGAVYAGKIVNGPTAFLYRAPSVGGTFELIADSTHASNVGGGTWGIWSAAINPLKPEEIAFVMGCNTINKKFYIGAAESYAEGAGIADSIFEMGLSYGLSKWLLTVYGTYYVVSADGSSVVSSGPHDGIIPHVRASTIGRTYAEKNGANATTIVGDNNLASTAEIAGQSISWGEFITHSYGDCDASGMAIMTRQGAGVRGKSSDGGVSWTALSSLPVGNYYFRYAGQTGSGITSSRWIAAGAVVRLSLDWGATWLNREGDINNAVLPNLAPSINIIRVVEY